MRTSACFLVLCLVAARTDAQSLPSEPIVVWRRTRRPRRRVHRHDCARRTPASSTTPTTSTARCAISASASPPKCARIERLQFLGEMRVDRGEHVRSRTACTRASDRGCRAASIFRLGGVPPTFGAFGRGAYGTEQSAHRVSAGVSIPHLAPHRRTAGDGRGTAAHARPRVARQLSAGQHRRRSGAARCQRVPLGHRCAGARRSGHRRVDRRGDRPARCPIRVWTTTTAAVSSRAAWSCTPTPALAIGDLCRAAAPFSVGRLQPSCRRHAGERCRSAARSGVDAEYSAGRFLGRGEIIWSRWTLPTPFTGGPLTAISVAGRSALPLLPGRPSRGARRASRLQPHQSGAERAEAWDAPVKRFEVGAGWSVATQRDVESVVAAEPARRRTRSARHALAPRRWSTGSDDARFLARSALTAAADAVAGCRVDDREQAPGPFAAGSISDASRDPPSAGPTPPNPGARAARPARFAPRRGVSRNGAAGRVRRTRVAARRDGPTQRDVRAACAGGDGSGPLSTFPTTTRPITTCFRSRKPSASISAATPRGKSKSVRFDRPGVVRVFCDIHSHMSAFVLVFNHPFFDVTEPTGDFGSTTCRRARTP